MPQTENMRRAALVTGGAKGIGRAVCLALAENGMDIAVNYAGSAAAAEETAAACRAFGVQAITLQADVRSPEACQNLVEDTAAAFGRIDVLVNNAGITADKLLMVWAYHQYQQCGRPARERGPGQLCRQQGGADRPNEKRCQRVRRTQYYRQCGGTWIY